MAKEAQRAMSDADYAKHNTARLAPQTKPPPQCNQDLDATQHVINNLPPSCVGHQLQNGRIAPLEQCQGLYDLFKFTEPSNVH